MHLHIDDSYLNYEMAEVQSKHKYIFLLALSGWIT